MKHNFEKTQNAETRIYKNELSETVLNKLIQQLNEHYQFVKNHPHPKYEDLCHDESIRGLTILNIVANDLSEEVYNEYLDTFFKF